ncbi:NAD(P)H-hydrate epimerase [[Candida] anglica]|uniref:NAD(P)H-hydrate epimerase n=1 Tax=[Candida] anglica TaxID=148631 RepID=A0ABP0EIU1_9ASCO
MLRTFKTLSSKAAAELDGELMSSGAFSIDQLMELAGLAVAQAIYKEYPPREKTPNNVLVLVGPGNNGGDGLVASRHLRLWGYSPYLYYPKKSSRLELYGNLLTQLNDLGVSDYESWSDIQEKNLLKNTELIVDSLFGFSFKPPVRSPFDAVLKYLSENHRFLPPIVSVDIPSGWDVDTGAGAIDIHPAMLVSLTAPKPCAQKFVESEGAVSHYLGGRFINQKIATKYGIEDLVNSYKGNDMIVKL